MKRDLEGPIHKSIVNYLRAVLPDGCIVHHCRNEINKRGAAFARELAEATRKGVVTGFPDLLVLTFSGVFLLEVKSEKGTVSPPQKDIHARLDRLGYRVAVVRSIVDVKAALAAWGVDTKEVAS